MFISPPRVRRFSALANHLTGQVLAAIIQNKPFDTFPPPHQRLWTSETVIQTLRSIPLHLFQSPRSIGRQNTFRHRSLLRQRNLRSHAEMEFQLFKEQMYYSTLRIAVIFLLSIGYSVNASSYNVNVDNYIAESYFNRYDSLIDQEFNNFVAKEIPLGLFKDKYHIVPTQSALHRNLTGEGSHCHLSSSIRFKLNHELKNELISHSCEVIIIERLPSGVFADPFELQHLVQRNVFTDVAVFGDKNLELPSFRSNRTVVEIHMSLASKMLSTHEDDLVVNIQVPLHARYPALGLGFSRVKFGQPDLFLCCNIKENVANMSCLSVLILDNKANSEVWEIPCGIKEHARIVSVVTFAFAVIVALLIVYTSITYSICNKL